MLNCRSLFLKCTARILLMPSSTSSMKCYSGKSTVSKEEVEKFSQHSKFWWDPNGPLRGLHSLNDLRVPFARDGLLNSKQVPMEARCGPQPLKGYKYVDVGCAAGLCSEALARIGADVTGIDANKELVQVAKEHASLDRNLADHLRYLNTTVEEHIKECPAHYDAVVCSEVIEHIEDTNFFVENCIQLVKPGGSLFFTTINKNLLAGFCAIFLAENVFKIIPKGTHQYRLLMPPKKLEQALTTSGCHVLKVQGTFLLPNGRWRWARSSLLSYAMHAVKRHA